MTRRPIVAGNWKMHRGLAEAATLTRGILKAVPARRPVDVVLCPPFTALSAVARLLKGTTIRLGAQNCHWEPQGAFTGEISAAMVHDAGARYCLLGHSERRALFGETNETVARKVQAVLAHGLTPILCVGETLKQRQAGRTLAVVEEQLRAGVRPVSSRDAARLIIAYEPVWAIGTGVNAAPKQAQEVHAFIRQRLGAWCTPPTAQGIRIQYGGSVTPENSAALIRQPDVDGFLVGGASLEIKSFTDIVKTTATATRTKNRGNTNRCQAPPVPDT